MRAVVLREHGGPEVLRIEDVPDPEPGPDEALVAVRATALNRADVLQRMGGYPGPPADLEIPGLDFAGTVIGLGERCRERSIGDHVMGIVAAGAYAERLVVHERQLIPVPQVIGLDDAAAIPEVFLTAWDAMVLQGGLTSGRRALVHAGASGVGTAAIQLAKAIGAFVAATCSPSKAAACRELGADWVFDRSPHDWRTDALAAVPEGFDVVVDVVGGEEVDRNLDVIGTRGVIMQVGLMGGALTPMNLGKLLAKRASIVGTTLRMRPVEEKIALAQRFTREVVPLFEMGALHPVVDRRFALDELPLAHEYMEANANIGKVLIDVRG
jgi:putative PIG3 family NAD(P)H quinone oxidoreductase